MKDFSDFEALARQQSQAITMKLMTTKYGRKSVSAADDAQYKREIEIAADASVEMLRRYHEWVSR